jgi:cytoskeletal protein RodZ
MKSERGNIIVYLLVGLVLFGVLVGGVWWVKNRVANKPTPVATTTEQKVVQPGTDTKVDQDSKPATKPAETKPAEQPAPAAPATPAQPTTPQNTTNNSSTPATGSTSGTTNGRASDLAALPPESRTASAGPSPNNVAATGPLENAIGTSLGLGIVTFLASSFVRSRKSAH